MMQPISTFHTFPADIHQTIAKKLPREDIGALRATCSDLKKSIEPITILLQEPYSMIFAFFPEEDVNKVHNSNLICDELWHFKKELSLSFTNPETILSEREELLNKLEKWEKEETSKFTKETTKQKTKFLPNGIMTFTRTILSIPKEIERLIGMRYGIKNTMIRQAALMAELSYCGHHPVQDLPISTLLNLCKEHGLTDDFTEWSQEQLYTLSLSNPSPFLEVPADNVQRLLFPSSVTVNNNPILYREVCQNIAAHFSSDPVFMQRVMEERDHSEYLKIVEILTVNGINATVLLNRISMDAFDRSVNFLKEKCAIC